MVSELMTQGSVDDLIHAPNAAETVSLRQRIKILQVKKKKSNKEVFFFYISNANVFVLGCSTWVELVTLFRSANRTSRLETFESLDRRKRQR